MRLRPLPPSRPARPPWQAPRPWLAPARPAWAPPSLQAPLVLQILQAHRPLRARSLRHLPSVRPLEPYPVYTTTNNKPSMEKR